MTIDPNYATAVFDVVRYNLIFRFVGANGIRPQATGANACKPLQFKIVSNKIGNCCMLNLGN
jgi:hypothetical protein